MRGRRTHVVLSHALRRVMAEGDESWEQWAWGREARLHVIQE